MELTDSFVVEGSLDETWALLNDVTRIAPCVPGAHLTEVVGDEYRGVVSVRLGALSVRVVGSARFTPDAARRRIVVLANGDGNHGAAEAHITASFEPISAESTQVNVDTDLHIAGRVATLGRGILPEVASALTAQFAANLAANLVLAESSGPDPFAGGATRMVDMPEPEALDLLDAARRPIMKRLVPFLAIVVGLLVTRRNRRDRRNRKARRFLRSEAS